MKILTANMCKVGGREYNQDYVAGSVDNAASCFIVCDGLGAYALSEDASRLCATKIIEQFERVRELDPARAVKRAYCEAYVENAHNHVVSHKERNPKMSQSCTTVAMAVTDGKSTVFAHIGDTRIYFFRKDRLIYQSKDHSLAQLAVEMGHIKLRDIRTHKDQNKLTRVLGSDYFAPPDIDIVEKPITPGDSVLLCSDGFWEYVYEEEMEEDLASSATPAEALAKMEKRLLARVSRFNDNYSVFLAMATDDGEATEILKEATEKIPATADRLAKSKKKPGQLADKPLPVPKDGSIEPITLVFPDGIDLRPGGGLDMIAEEPAADKPANTLREANTDGANPDQ